MFASALADRFGRFLRDARGSVTMLVSLSLLPILMASFAALDYGRVSDARSRLNAAADAAALGAVTPSAMKASANDARAEALTRFRAAATAVRGAHDVVPSITVSDAQGDRTVTVSYTAVVDTTIANLFRSAAVSIGGTSRSASTLPPYIDFYVLLDNTPSMGVGATQTDIDTMVANTPDQCAFACHDLSADGNDYYTLAKSLGVKMRIDVVRAATQQLMDTASSAAILPGQYRAAIYTMGPNCSNTSLTTISSLRSNLTQSKQDAAQIDVMAIPYQGFNNDMCSDHDGVFTALNQEIPTAGDGSSSANPQKVLFIVSDGVADAYYPSTCTQPTTDGRCQEPITVANCTTLKSRGIKIAALYTTYLPLPTNDWYNSWIAPFQSTIGSNMQACASPGFYFEVSPTQGIGDAMNALFKKAIAQARITK